MNEKIKLFLKTIDMPNHPILYRRIQSFVKEYKQKVLFKDGQLFFIQGKSILDTQEIKNNCSLIVEFDGTKMRRISQAYYLGKDADEASIYDGKPHSIDLNLQYTTLPGSSNNNNNNNNNNGNNNNG